MHAAQDLDVDGQGLVRQLHQALGTGQQLRAEVGGRPEAVDVEVPVIDELGQLVDVLGFEEACLVDDQLVEGPAGRPLITHECADVRIGGDPARRMRQSDPSRDLRAAGAVVANEQQAGA